MKVEIDADELCELRKSNEYLAEYNRTLSHQLADAHAGNVDYQVKCDWKKLKEERDWWRDKAIERGMHLHEIQEVSDRLYSGQLADEAGALGYK